MVEEQKLLEKEVSSNQTNNFYLLLDTERSELSEIPTTPLITKDLLTKSNSSLLTAGICPICLGQGYVPNLSVTSGIECCNKCFGSGVCI